MKKNIAVLLVFVFFISLATTTALAEDTIKIGLFQPLTGKASYMGNPGNNAALLAVKQINEAGGILGKKVELVSYDDKSSPDEALKAVQRMVELDEVDIILGSLHSGNIQVCGDYCEENEVVLIGTGTSPAWLQQGWTYLFRATLNTYYSSLASVQACQALGLTKLAIFNSLDDYGKNGANDMNKLCEEYGLEVVREETMNPGDTDLTAQCTNITNANPEVVYVIATADNLPQMVKQLRANGFDSYIIGEQSLNTPEVKDVAGRATDNIVFGALFTMPVNSPDEANTPEQRQFFADYLKEYGEMLPSEVGVRCYDAVYLMKEGFEIAGSTDGEAVRDALYSISDFKGLQGSFDFASNKNGEGLTSANLFIIQDFKDIPMSEYLETHK